jgi:hypothetical protein
MKMTPRRSNMLSIGQQAFLLKNSIANAKVSTGIRSLEFRALVRPTAISREYDLRIRYEIGKHPVSTILAPNIGELTTKKIPHLWKVDPYELCLYFSPEKEWLPHMHLARTIFPWSLEWMFFFECWLGSGEWDGGGTVHN